MRSRVIAATIAIVVSVSLGTAPGVSAKPTYDRACGTPGGQGYVNIVRVANMTCRHGVRVAFKARKKFCDSHNGCPFEPVENFYRGTVYRNGWRCKVALGYEYFRVKGRRGNQRFVYLTGA